MCRYKAARIVEHATCIMQVTRTHDGDWDGKRFSMAACIAQAERPGDEISIRKSSQ